MGAKVGGEAISSVIGGWGFRRDEDENAKNSIERELTDVLVCISWVRLKNWTLRVFAVERRGRRGTIVSWRYIKGSSIEGRWEFASGWRVGGPLVWIELREERRDQDWMADLSKGRGEQSFLVLLGLIDEGVEVIRRGGIGDLKCNRVKFESTG
ncbi:hypothetical protein Tco_1039744 [Tanacetum coccineum]